MLNFEYFLNLEKKNLPLHRIIINNGLYDKSVLKILVTH